ncbi:MAG: hypothetical protein NTW74_08465 [Acidobacteria bacterium]|nr:hypothetical protein [Acidobacteriota bacterium]
METLEVAAISGLVAMIEVSDVEVSAAFYQKLSFRIGNREPATGKMGWAWLYSPKVEDWRRGPNLMLRKSESSAKQMPQGLILYLYAAQLKSLREELLGKGLEPSEISYPPYLPEGVFQIFDPDGYCLIVAQSGSNTP